MMKVKASEMVKLFLALGVETAATWDYTKLVQRLGKGKISKYKETDEDLATADLNNLYNDVLSAQEGGQPIEIEDDIAKKSKSKPEPKEKPEGEKKPARKRVAEPELSYAERVASWAKNPLPLSKKGPGIIRAMVDVLKKAGKNEDHPKPITKEDILAELKKKYPDRDAGKMATTVNNHIPTRLKVVRGIHVWRGRTADGKFGYYIVGEGAKPQPEESKPKRLAPVRKQKEGKAEAEKTSPNPPAKKEATAKATAKSGIKKPPATAKKKQVAKKKK